MRSLPLADPGVPDLRSGRRFLGWIAGQQASTLAIATVFGVLWMGAQAVLPFALGRALDEGIAGEDRGKLWLWAGALLGIGLVQAGAGLMRHRYAVTNFLIAGSTIQQLIARQVVTLGAELPAAVGAGEVATATGTDMQRICRVLDMFARFIGAIVAFITVAALLLIASPALGAVVVIGVPVLVLAIGPLVRPLERRERAQREMLGQASAMAADTVSGLRVLRGFGGEDTFVRRFRRASGEVRVAATKTAALQSVLDALQVLLPGAFVVIVTWLGARFALEGRITPGELVAFYAYSAFLVIPLKTFTEFARKWAAATVSSGRVVSLLSHTRTITEPTDPSPFPATGARLTDVDSGLVVRPATFTAVACTDPVKGSALADRLGRYTDGEVRLGDVPLQRLPLHEVRRRVLVSDKDPVLISGPLREALDPPRLGRQLDLETVLDAASADDAIDGLEGGLEGDLTERGRSLSGGQRQRLALVRALLADPEILVLDEPTSAVDAHTEVHIAERLRGLRDGRATVVFTTSPLLLDRADTVVLVDGDRVSAEGTHRELMTESPVYRDLVTRGEELSTKLPVATALQVREHVGVLVRRHRRPLLLALGLHAGAVLAGLVGPRVLGDIVEGIRTGMTTATVDKLALIFAAALVVQALLTRWARYRSAALGETVLAELREDFLEDSAHLPLGTVERAGTGDLVTRSTTDIENLSYAVRLAAPEISVALLSVLLIGAAAVVTSPLLAAACLVGAPPIVLGTRWYRKRADEGYRAEMATFGEVNTSIGESAAAARTVEALGLQSRRIERSDDDIRSWINAERYTLWLRSVWFPSAEIGYVLPIVGVVVAGGFLFSNGQVNLGEVTAVALYVQMLIEPVDLLISWLDELQIGKASMARLLGVRYVPPGPASTDEVPASTELVAEDVRFSYRDGHDVLHGIDLAVVAGSRIAIVGPSGAGKSTLGRLLAGVHPPRSGRVTVGGVDVSALEPAVLREQVALVTQEHHVFVGTLHDNVVLARPGADIDAVRAALDAVDALAWADALPDGLDTVVGSGGHALAPAEAQQVALARIVLADPHTLVLDEATSLLDPRAARHLERSLAAVLHGRTVIAIAHRLHTAHDADKVAVVEDGRVAEFGSHDELMASGGAYAALWASWREGSTAVAP